MKRILSILLAISLLCLMIPDVYAAAEMRLSIMGVSAKAEAGTEVRVPVMASDGFRYAAGIVDVSWDPEALILKEVEFTDHFAPDNGSAPVTNSGEYRVSVGDYNAEQNYIGNGVFFTLIYEVAENVKPASYKIELTNSAFYDKHMDPVYVEKTTGYVTLSVCGTLSLAVQSVTAAPNAESISVPVTAERNDGFAAAIVDVIWDPDALILNGIAFNDKLAPDNNTRPVDNSGHMCISFGSGETYKDFTGSGTFFTLEFLPAKNIVQEKYEISLADPDAVSSALLPLNVETKSGVILITDQPEAAITTAVSSGIVSDETTAISSEDSSEHSSETNPVSKTTAVTAETTAKPVSKATTTVTAETTAKPVTKTTTTVTDVTTAKPVSKTTTTVTAETTAKPVSKTTTTVTAETTAKPVSKVTTTVTAETTAKPASETTATTAETTAKPASETTATTAETTAKPASETTTDVTTTAQPDAPAKDGDYNNDGSVTVADLVLFTRFIAEDTTLPQQQIQIFVTVKTDFDNDGLITLIDVRVLLKIIFNTP
ncbi:MAG: hypothetical protein IKQ91_02085 [Oscillospiraceae bacterium]|nr:hypothetical protein [Oscillospiraceae bacterium]